MKKLIFFIILLLILLSGFYLYSKVAKKVKIDETLIEIKKNTNSKQIAQTLFNNGIINNPQIFYYYVRIFKYDRSLQAGSYLFRGKQNIIDVVNTIRKGKVYLEKITFPEGWTYKKIAWKLAKRGFVNYGKFIKLCTDSVFVKKVTTYSKPSLEGFLYPDTYYFPQDVSEQFIIKKMVQNFYNRTKELNLSKDIGLDFYQILTIASIVERESGLESEKPLIAGVYIKRFLSGYKLQADPTVAYTLELMGKKRKKLYYKDLEIDSPYNTYLYKGLPPTPIANPSVKTIQAVINYEPTDYLFFFANQGRHIFSKSYKAHIKKQNIIKFSR